MQTDQDYTAGARTGFERFLSGFISRHPEWYGEFESQRARERFEEALAKVPAAEPLAGDSLEAPVAKQEGCGEAVSGVMEMAPGGIPMFQDWDVAEEVRDEEEAEAEEAAAVLDEF